MKRLGLALVLFTVFLASFLTVYILSTKSLPVQATPVLPEDRSKVEQAIYQAVHEQEGERLVTLIYQTQVVSVTFSSDGMWAKAWLVPVNSQTGEIVPVEPGMAMVRKEDSQWTVFLQPDPAWLDAVMASPEDLIPKDEKAMWAVLIQQVKTNLPAAPFTGYRLPWKAGETKYVSETLMHDKYYPSKSSHYAFDFYQPGVEKGLHWDIYAAKSGTVYMVKDDVPTCDLPHCEGQGSGNYIIIKDTSTTPTSYALYLHLVQNSIPPGLKNIGTPVQRGQFIAVADNTGASYGNHLHFQVQTAESWFGTSVDITFEDVDINGGRPRIKEDQPYCLHSGGYNDVCDDFQYSYYSRNTPCQIPDSTPPTGELLQPDRHGIPLTGTITLSGWGEDTECGLAAGQFIIKYDGAWQNIGPAFTTSPFTYNLDTCSLPDGPVEVGLRLTDQAANYSIPGAWSLSKDYTCPAPPKPACLPNANQVSLFNAAEYAGTCVLYGPGNYTDLGQLGGQVSSIMVGANVQASLSLADNFTGRTESFYANDNNLSDNRVGTAITGSLQVNLKNQLPEQPRLLSPSNGSNLSLGDVVTLFWENGAATTEAHVLLSEGPTVLYSSTVLTETAVQYEGLPVGVFTWKVRGRNPAGVGSWSQTYTFTITVATPATPPSVSIPYTDTMESTPTKWTATGLWRLVTDSSLAHSGTRSWWYQGTNGNYDNGQPNSGDLTSPIFTISTTNHYYLRFYYRYTTETQAALWDQRLIQISIDNGPFRLSTQSIARQQLTDDPFAGEMDLPYLSSQVYDLGILSSGQSVRIRFHFDTLDAFKNAYEGWAIDDVGITTTPPGDPADSNEPNNAPNEATVVTPGIPINGVISPRGDFDFFQFTAASGDRIVADIDAQSLGSILDPYLYLLDSNGYSVLASNDDEIYAVNRDSFITFIAPHDGIYYLKLRAWNNPRAGGSQYFYTLHLYIDNADPALTFNNPGNNAGYINGTVNTLAAAVTDTQSGISRVDFYFHDNDWINDNWELLGSDTNGADGWSVPFIRTDQSGVAVYVKATDRSRNVAGQGYWYLSIDKTPPVSTITPLAGTQASTAFLLEWTSSDNLSGIDHFELQWAIDGSTWQNYPLAISGYTQSTWVIGNPGHTYAFRMRAIDIAGNAELMPSVAETSTYIPANICTAPDVWEVDNTDGLASSINVNQTQNHNFCNPEDPHGLNDADWVKFSTQAGKRYLVQAISTAPDTAPEIGIYTSDGITLTLRATMTQTILGKSAYIDWIATKNEVLYIRIQHSDERVAGNSVTYQVYVTDNYPIFLPVLARQNQFTGNKNNNR